ncbi:MAG: hypothetical protein AAF449_24655 [Myxococcota bacterium]
MMQELHVGVDVAKDWLDIQYPDRGARRLQNAPAALKAFSAARAKEGAWIVFEASGGYDHLLRAALKAAQVRFSRVNPRQARDFARAMSEPRRVCGRRFHASYAANSVFSRAA